MFLMMQLRLSQALPNQVYDMFGRFYASPRLLLKYVKDIERFREADSINRTIRIRVEILHDFQDRSAAKSFQRLAVQWLVAELGFVYRVTDALTHGDRKLQQIPFAGTDEKARSRRWQIELHWSTMVI